MADPVTYIAQAAAEALSEGDPRLVHDVEAELHGDASPRQYADPMSIAALIVSVATLAWQVYSDLRKQTPEPAPDVVARGVRVELPAGDHDPREVDRVVEVVVREAVRVAPKHQ